MVHAQPLQAVDACLALRDELAAAAAESSPSAPRVLVAVDDYNALHAPTGMWLGMCVTVCCGMCDARPLCSCYQAQTKP